MAKMQLIISHNVRDEYTFHINAADTQGWDWHCCPITSHEFPVPINNFIHWENKWEGKFLFRYGSAISLLFLNYNTSLAHRSFSAKIVTSQFYQNIAKSNSEVIFAGHFRQFTFIFQFRNVHFFGIPWSAQCTLFCEHGRLSVGLLMKFRSQ